MGTTVITGINACRVIAARLKAAEDGKLLRRTMTARLKEVGAPAVDEVKQAVMAVQSRGVGGGGTLRRTQIYAQRYKRTPKGGTGLRASVARCVKSRVSYRSASIVLLFLVDSNGMPYSQRKLPKYLDGHGRWRHPVYGHRDRWVGQTGQEYFENTLTRQAPRIKDGAQGAIDDFIQEIS